MIRVNQLKLNIGYSEDDLRAAAAKALGISFAAVKKTEIVKRSIDARDKSNIHYSIAADVLVENERNVLKSHRKNNKVSLRPDDRYILPQMGSERLETRPVIVGSGPAGLFCAYFLAKNGYRPVLIERGEAVEDRMKTVESFWMGKSSLNPESNIQFGEGGAGTFSDGKLNTGVKDPAGRNRLVLETFAENGAGEDILYNAKPHVGTDRLCIAVKNMREAIISCGGEVHFNTKLEDIILEDGRLNAITVSENGNEKMIECSALVLAVGHSARDTFEMINSKGFEITAKPFAVGVRAEHLQEDINKAQYGSDYKEKYRDKLPAADYKLTAHTEDGHSVYSFCMCPGGYVVNSSSETGMLCVNGMSYSERAGINANSAIVVNVTPEDTGSVEDPMNGVKFQRDLERKAFEAGAGLIPVQLFGDFKEGKTSSEYGRVSSQTKGHTKFADLNVVLPEFVSKNICEAFEKFGRTIKGYDSPDTVLSAVESRTSSPIRIVRNERLESNFKGIYPCGEGAGYAGGITSAAIDGIKVFEEIYKRYSNELKGEF